MTQHNSSYKKPASFTQAGSDSILAYRSRTASPLKLSARIALLLAGVSSFSIISTPARSESTSSSQQGSLVRTFSPAAGVTSDPITDPITNGKNNTPLSVEQAGQGTTLLSAINSYTGATLIKQGTLALSGDGSIASSSGISIEQNANFDISKANSGVTVQDISGAGNTALGTNGLTLSSAQSGTPYSGVMSGTGGLTIADGVKTLSGQNNYTGDTTVAQKAGLDLTGSIAGNVTNNGTLNASNATLSNALNNNGQATFTSSKAGNVTNAEGATFNATGGSQASAANSGTMTLTGGNTTNGDVTNTNKGALTLDGSTIAGVLNNGGLSTLQNGSSIVGVVTNGGTLNASNATLSNALNNSGQATLTSSKTGDVTNAEGATFNAAGGSQASAANSGTMTLTGGNTTNGQIINKDQGTLKLDGSTISGVLNNSGLSTLQNGSSVVGVVTNSGTLNASNTTLSNALNNTGSTTLTNSKTGGDVTNTKRGTLTLDGSTIAGALNNRGLSTLQNGSSVTGVVANSGTLNASNTTLNNALNNTGSATLTNSKTGDVTNINQGTLKLDGSTINGTLTHNGAGLTVTSNSANANSLAGSSNGTLNGTLSLNNAQDTYSGILSGNGGLTVNGGTETLTGAQTYTGNTAINNGATLALAGNGNLEKSTILLNVGNVTGQSTLDISKATHEVSIANMGWGNNNATVNLGGNTLNIASAIGSNGAIFQGDGGTLIISGTSQALNGTIRQTPVDSETNSDGTTSGGTTTSKDTTKGVNLVANATDVTLNSGKSFSYTGSTTVNSGSNLHVNGNNYGTSSVVVHDDGKLDGTGNIGSTSSTTTIEQNGTITPGTSDLHRGTLGIGGNLIVNGTSDFSGVQDNGSGKLSNGTVFVGSETNGNLTLGGTVKAVDLSFQQGSGVQTLYRYTQQLTLDNPTLKMYQTTGAEDPNNKSVLQAGNHQVNLVAANTGDNLTFWNGSTTTANGQVNGGDGTWTQGQTNWTTSNGDKSAAWQKNAYAIFGQASDSAIQQNPEHAFKVTVAGNVDVGGMQFSQTTRPSSYSVIPQDENSSITLHGNRYTDRDHPDQLNHYFSVTDNTGQSGTPSDADIKQYEQNNGILVNKSGLVSIVRVGDGTGYGDTNLAVINTSIKDDPSNPTTLVKTDTGTLILNGTNSYTGGTVITNGTLGITSDASLGDQKGALNINGGTLRIEQDQVSTNANRNTILGFNGATIDLNGYEYSNNGSIVGPKGADLKIVSPILDHSTYDQTTKTPANPTITQLFNTAQQNAGISLGGDKPVLNLNGNNTYLGNTDIEGNHTSGGSNIVVNANSTTPFGYSNSTTKGGDLNITGGATVNMNGGQDQSASMGNRNVTVGESSSTYPQDHSVLNFNNKSVADTAHITNNGNASVVFKDSSSASQSTIQNAGGVVFAGHATADAATIQNNSDSANVDISGTANGVSIGSLSGNGSISLGKQTLTIGALNKNDTLSATIQDGGAGGSLIKAGSGTQTLTGANNYTGSTTVQNGTLALAGNGTIAPSSFVDIKQGANLDLSQSSNNQNLSDIRGGGNVALGSHSLSLTKANADYSYDGIISGTGGLTIQSGTKTLTNKQAYTGDTTVAQAGGLNLAGSLAGALANSGKATLQNGSSVAGDVTNSGTLNATNATLGSALNNSGKATLQDGSSVAGDVTNSGTGNLTATNAKLNNVTTDGTLLLDKGTTVANKLAANGGTFTIGEGGASVGSLAGNGTSQGILNDTLTLTKAKDSYAGSLSGNGGLTVAGGIATLSGTNTYKGDTHVTSAEGAGLNLTGSIAGKLINDQYAQITGPNARVEQETVNNKTLDVSNGATLAALSNNGSATFTGSKAGDVTNAAGATFNATGGSQASATNSGTMTLTGGNTTNGDVTNNDKGTLTLDGSTIANALNNSGKATLTNSKAGDVTNKDQGTLTLDGSTINGTLTHDGAGLTVTSNNATAGSLAGSSNGTLDGTLHLNNATGTYNGSLSGHGGLAIDKGTETLTGKQAYTGDTTVAQAGGLNLAGSLAGALANSGKATLQNGSSVAGDVTNSGTLNATNATLGSALNNSGKATLQDGSSVAGDVTNSGTGNLTATNAKLNNVTTDGTLLLDKGTTVANKLAANGGTFTIGEGGASVGSLAGNGTSQGILNDTLTLTKAKDSYAGSLSGNGGLTVAGGIATLSGTNTYKGDTHVTSAEGAGLNLTGSIAGKLINDQYAQITGPNARVEQETVNNKTLDVSNGATLAALSNNGSATFTGSKAGDVTNAAGATFNATGGSQASATNSGTMTLTGGNTTNGDVTNSGTLQATNATLNSALNNSGKATLTNSKAGDVTNKDQGTLTLDGSTINGTLTHDGAGLTVTSNNATAGSLAGSSNGTLDGTLHLNNATGTYNGSLSGNGGLAIDKGTETLTGKQAYTGDTTVAQAGGLNLAGSLAGALANSGKATLQDGSSVAGDVTNSGTGNLTATNAKLNNVTTDGTLLLDKGTTVANKLAANGGTFTIGEGGASVGSLAGNGTSQGILNDTLTLTKAKDSYAGSLSGNGGLTVAGGTEILTGNSTYSGPTMLQNQATLEVDGNNGLASGLVTVGNGATLRGIGTVGSTQVASEGVIAPGTIGSNTPSTLHINGDLTMAQGSILRIRGTSDTTGQTIDTAKGTGYQEAASDRLAVTGKANLQGGTLDLQLKNAGLGLTYNQAYRILTATGGISGQFDSKLSSNLAPQYAYLDPTFAYSADAVDIVMRRKPNSFSIVGETRNQITAGRGLDRLDQTSALSQAMTGLTKTQARQALDNLSGELHASIRTALIQDSFYIHNAAMNRLANSDCDYGRNGQSLYDLKTHQKNGACYSDHAVLWGQAYGGLGHNGGDGNAALMHHNTAGFIMGADAPINHSNWRVGGLLSYGHSQFNVQRGHSSSGNSNNISVGAYAGTHWGRLNLRLGAAYSWNVINTRRQISVGDYGGRVNSGYLGGTAQTFAELGYKMRGEHGVFEPFMNVSYVNMQTNSYREHGNEAALRSRGTDAGVTFSTFGFRAATRLNIGRTIFTPHLTAAYRRGFGRLGSRQHESFAMTGGSSSMDVAGVLLSDNAAIIDTGVTASLNDHVDLDLSYIGQYGNQSTESGATGSFKMKF
ncbi:autotransporter-associated beta strand repeat-containing protein [Bombella favorum]|nr:autotransporter-associated beta strand repeat-containing protein [Bombella favorum]